MSHQDNTTHGAAAEPAGRSNVITKSGLAVIETMLTTLTPEALAELERALRRQLRPPKGSRGALWKPAVCKPRAAIPALTMEDYDARRWEGWPQAKRLMEAYGTWEQACRSAFGFSSGLPYRGHSVPNPSSVGGRAARRRYEDKDCILALQRFHAEHGFWPTTTRYRDWRRRTFDKARAAGNPNPPLPDYECFRARWTSWANAVAASGHEGRQQPRVGTQALPEPIITPAAAARAATRAGRLQGRPRPGAAAEQLVLYIECATLPM